LEPKRSLFVPGVLSVNTVECIWHKEGAGLVELFVMGDVSARKKDGVGGDRLVIRWAAPAAVRRA
jgi:hypothetical protein